ncbi:ionotropic receptor 75a-like [Anopheles nili]|uniref:ionotropic receptor 75a-like n=1 Tax=Anopheles nili TaxID=185578 RepID=UPI00237B2282|nr:ionotropic receptor 75a-like [Anopheles nili]
MLIDDFIHHSTINSLTVVHCHKEPPDRDVAQLAQKLHHHFRGPVAYISLNAPIGASSRIGVRSLHRLGLIMNLECVNHQPFLQQASLGNHFNSSYRWLFFGGQNLTDSLAVLSTLNINIDANVVLAIRHRQEQLSYALYDVYGSMKALGGAVQSDFLGDWTPTSGWPGIARKRENLHQIELRAVVSTLNQHQPQSLEKHLNSVPDYPRSYHSHMYAYQLTKLLMLKLNFRVKLILAESWHLELIGTNSSLGVMGQLQTKQVDFSLSPFAILSERLAIFDPTIEIMRGNLYTTFRHPKARLQRSIFLLPFENAIWITLLAILACFSVTLSACFVLQQARQRQNRNEVSLALLITLGILAQQGLTSVRMTLFSGKILLLAAFLMCGILLQYYSSFIIGYQLMEQPHTINTLKHLLASEMTVSIEDISYNRDFFNRTNDPVAIELYHARILPNKDGFQHISAGLTLVKQGGHAFHCDIAYGNHIIIETFTEKEICELHYIQLYPSRAINIPMAKGSPLKELFKLNLQIIREAGILAYQQSRYYSLQPKCIRDNLHTERVELFDILTALELLGIGAMLSVVILLAEIGFSAIQRCWLTRFMPKDFVWLD